MITLFAYVSLISHSVPFSTQDKNRQNTTASKHQQLKHY